MLVLVVFVACKKDDTTNSTDPKSTWTIEGTTYTSTTPATFNSSDVLSAVDNNLNGDIEITLPERPTVTTSYPVSENDSSAGGGAGLCIVNITTPSVSNYKGTGSEMLKVSVVNGKLTATFSNMQMKKDGNTSIGSGEIIEK